MLHYLRVSWKYIKCQKNGTSANWIPWETQNMYSTIFSMYESKSSSFNVNFSFGAYVVVFVHLLFKNKKWKRQNTGWYFEKKSAFFCILMTSMNYDFFSFCKAIVQNYENDWIYKFYIHNFVAQNIDTLNWDLILNLIMLSHAVKIFFQRLS